MVTKADLGFYFNKNAVLEIEKRQIIEKIIKDLGIETERELK